jgi:hypothetical protein
VIGAVFDGNIHSLGGAYGYDPQLNRSVHVASSAIQEALLKVYDQPHLVAELNGPQTAAPNRRAPRSRR